MAHLFAIACAVAPLAGCVVPFATPPLKADLGATTRSAGDNSAAAGRALHGSIGAHLASGVRRPHQPLDVGVGYAFDRNATRTNHGGYIEASWFVDRVGRRRTAIGGRGEFRALGGEAAFAAKLRLDIELFGPAQDTFEIEDRCGIGGGVVTGIGAIGGYVEAGRMWAPAMLGGSGWVATAGIAVRLPGTLGVYVGIPGCR